MKTASNQSALKVLQVLKCLMRHFVHGLTPGDIARATSLPASAITRYVATLEEEGLAERIPETGRIRPSIRLAQDAVRILNEVEKGKSRLDEIQARLTIQ